MGVANAHPDFQGKMYKIKMGATVDEATDKPIKEGITQMTFVNNIAHSRFIILDWTDKLKGVEVYFWLFGVREATNEDYGGWTFPSPTVWDEFFYSQNKIAICRVKQFRLGDDSP